MSSRAEVSDKNKYWISKHRYYELKHYCLQYNEWKASKRYFNTSSVIRNCGNDISDPTTKHYDEDMAIVEKVSMYTDPVIGSYIFKSVTEGYSYESLRALYDIPCSRDVYYSLYRKFFWILDKYKSFA